MNTHWTGLNHLTISYSNSLFIVTLTFLIDCHMFTAIWLYILMIIPSQKKITVITQPNKNLYDATFPTLGKGKGIFKGWFQEYIFSVGELLRKTKDSSFSN